VLPDGMAQCLDQPAIEERLQLTPFPQLSHRLACLHGTSLAR
jgi:hypothetical protein